MQVKLSFKNKQALIERTLKVGDMIEVGRSSKSDFQFEDERMSSKHCRLNLKFDRLEIIDLDSKNGTYLNGIRVDSSQVFLGDKIRIGATIITMDEHSLDSDAVRALTFPGPAKDRMSFELKADFTGARINNQSADGNVGINASATHEKEIELRKKAKSKIKLSKHELKLRYKVRSLGATSLDIVVMMVILIIPLIVSARLIPATISPQQKNNFLMMVEALVVVIFFFINFKMAKFTIGERVAGLRSLYLKQ